MIKKLYIRFRNDDGSFDIYKSPPFDFLIAVDDFDEFVCYGDGDFYINCDVEWHNNNIIFLMFDAYSETWIKELFLIWKKNFKSSPIPDFNEWEKIGILDEAYQ
jgi:hypothetical protein